MASMSFRETTQDLMENSLKIRVAVFFHLTCTRDHIPNSTSTSANEMFSVYLPRCGLNHASMIVPKPLS
jgi:hypothetical protein